MCCNKDITKIFYITMYITVIRDIYTGGTKSITRFYFYDIEKVFLLNPKEIFPPFAVSQLESGWAWIILNYDILFILLRKRIPLFFKAPKTRWNCCAIIWYHFCDCCVLS